MGRYTKHISVSYSEIIHLCYIILKIILDLTDAELGTKWKFCNDLLSALSILSCGDCKKRGKLFPQKLNLHYACADLCL